METLQRFQNWYKSNCNGEWEHQYGVSIDTLDNPGWKVSIDLNDTNLETLTFEGIKIDRTDDDWVHCRVNNRKFEGFGGPFNLAEILEIFLNWANP